MREKLRELLNGTTYSRHTYDMWRRGINLHTISNHKSPFFVAYALGEIEGVDIQVTTYEPRKNIEVWIEV